MTVVEAIQHLRAALLPELQVGDAVNYKLLDERAKHNEAITLLERTLDGYRQTVGAKRG